MLTRDSSLRGIKNIWKCSSIRRNVVENNFSSFPLKEIYTSISNERKFDLHVVAFLNNKKDTIVQILKVWIRRYPTDRVVYIITSLDINYQFVLTNQ